MVKVVCDKMSESGSIQLDESMLCTTGLLFVTVNYYIHCGLRLNILIFQCVKNNIRY